MSGPQAGIASTSQSSVEVKPVHYDPVFSFKYKSFVYLISLASALESDHYLHGENGPLQPGCVAILKGTKELILRLTNLEAEGMSRTGRVENEVAITKLASSALSSYQPSIVPHIYAWGGTSGGSAQGWNLQEHCQDMKCSILSRSWIFTRRGICLVKWPKF